jgi:RNA polymerase sigma-32 factor
MAQVGRVFPMSREEELAATTEYLRTGDPRLASRIASANLRLVISVAMPYARRSRLPVGDLVQEGTVGLMEAIRRYDPKRGVRFATYATFWIRALVLKYLLDHCRLVRAGRSRGDRERFFNGQPPTSELSLDAPLGEEGRSLLDLLPAASRPDQDVEEAETRALVHRRAIAFENRLDARKAEVFRQRFLGDASVTLGRLAARFHVSKERVRQIEKDLVDDFRDFAFAA